MLERRTRWLIALLVTVVATLRPDPAAAVQIGDVAPPISATRWLNGSATRDDLAGKVVLVEFWTFGCFNCRNVEPHVKDWQARFAPQGLVVVGVHTPETSYERDPQHVADYVREHGLAYTIAIDGDETTWKRYGNEAWPAWYVVDRTGRVRYTHVGEGAYDETERRIRELLAE